jgi:hypothetical protein
MTSQPAKKKVVVILNNSSIIMIQGTLINDPVEFRVNVVSSCHTTGKITSFEYESLLAVDTESRYKQVSLEIVFRSACVCVGSATVL